MKKLLLMKTVLLLFALVVGSGSVWADPTVLFHETFGNNTGSARDWSDTYSVKSGVSAVYSGITSYTVSNVKQGKNTTGFTQSGLNQSSQGTDAYIIIGPLSVANYNTLKLIYQWKAGSTKGTYSTHAYYATSAQAANGTWTEVSGSGTGATTFVERSYNLPEAAQVSTLYLKIVWNTSNTQAIIDEVDLSGVVASGGGGSSTEPSVSLNTNSISAPEEGKDGTINVTYNNLTNYDADVIFYESDGTTYASYDQSWLTAEINASTKNLDYSITANTGAARTAYLKIYAVGEEGDVESSLITVTQAAKTVTAPTYNPDGGSYMQGTNITISSAGNTIYYNLTTDGSTPGNPTNASTEYTAPIALGSGTTKIKAIAYDTYGNASSVVTRTYTGIAPATLPFSWTGTKTAAKDELAAETGVAVSLGSNYAESNAPYRLKFDGVGKNVTIYTDGKPENVYFTAKLFNDASTGSKIKVQGSVDGITFTDVEEFTIKGSANDTFEFMTSNAFASTHKAVKLVMSSKDQNVGVGTICVSCIPLTPAKTYTTLTHKYALDFTSVSSDLKAYIATEIADSKVQMTQVNKVPAGTGLVLKATTTGSAINVPVFDGTGADNVAANKMAGSATATTEIAENGGYILKDGVFQPASAGTLAAGKAYLAIGAGARALEMSFDEGEVTAIETVKSEKANNEYFNLAGQRVANPTKGLYIVNGKKVIIK